jgi:hypothetical protein
MKNKKKINGIDLKIGDLVFVRTLNFRLGLVEYAGICTYVRYAGLGTKVKVASRIGFIEEYYLYSPTVKFIRLL